MSGEEDTCRRAEDAVALALHALGPHEEAELREHLAGCPSCRATVSEAEHTAAALAEGVEQIDPPARLRDNILAQAAQTPQVRSAPARDAAGAAGQRAHPARSATRPRAEAGSGPRRPPSGTEPEGRRDPRGPGRRRRRILVSVLALVAVLGVAGAGGLAAYTVQLQQQRDAQIARTEALAEALTQVGQPGTSQAALSTTEGQPVGAVVTGTSARVVVTEGLPANDRNTSIYVLWGVSPDAAPQPIGTFDVDPTSPGPGVHQLGPAGQEQPFIGYAISLEPGRAAPTAPTTVVASGQVHT